MNADVGAVRALLQGLDPVDELRVPSAHHEALLQRIVQMPEEGRAMRRRDRRNRRPVLSAVTACVIVALAAIVVQLGSPGAEAPLAQAATPELLQYQPIPGTVKSNLQRIARQFRTSPGQPTSGTKRYAYVNTQSWSLFTRVDGQQVRSAVVPEMREIWVAADGSGRLRVAAGVPSFPSEQSRQAWQAAGRPRPGIQDIRYPGGGLSAMYPRVLPEDVGGLRAALAVSHPVRNGPAETLVAISDLYNEQLPSGLTRASILDALAEVPGLQLQGRTIDRVGRPGVAVGVISTMTGLPTRFTLVFDEHDGRLLDQEQVLTTTAGRLDVPIPSVISYTTYLAGGWVDDVDGRPGPN